MENCIFCKIISGEIPCSKVYEDDRVLAFRDIAPAAPIHVIVIPKQHVQSILQMEDIDSGLLAHIFKVINIIAKDENIDSRGFRIVNNCGEDGGQTVPHLHFHLLGGRSMTWPPG